MPRDFRGRFGHEIEADIKDGWHEAETQGKIPGFFLKTLLDLVLASVREFQNSIPLDAVCSQAITLILGCLIGMVDVREKEVQGVLLVTLMGGVLSGAIWPRKVLQRGPILWVGFLVGGLIAASPLSTSGSVGLFLSFVGVVGGLSGSALSYLVRNQEGTLLPTFVAVMGGLCAGIADFVFGTPWVIVLAAFAAGVAFGRNSASASSRLAITFGFSTPISIVALMALKMHPARHHFVLIDLRAVPLAWIGTWIGSHFPNERSRDQVAFSR